MLETGGAAHIGDLDRWHELPGENCEQDQGFHPLTIHQPTRLTMKYQPRAGSCRAESVESSPERELWLSVFWKAMVDANYKPRKSNKPSRCMAENRKKAATATKSKNTESELNRYHARNWLSGDSEDFRLVCHLAGLDPTAALEQAAKPFRKPERPRSRAGNRHTVAARAA